MSPAQYVVFAFGGVRRAARAIGRSPCQLSKWPKPEEVKGCGGRIPAKAQRTVLEVAKKLGIDISAEDLIMGRTVTVEKPNG